MRSVAKGYRGEESLLRPPCEGFQCGETIIKEHAENDNHNDDDYLLLDGCTVRFHCTLPNSIRRLEFQCREPSCGVLIGDETKVEKKENDVFVDPNFFDTGYTLAGATGWQVWPGSRLLVETLTWPQPSLDGRRLEQIQEFLANGANVLELGAGVGMVGCCLANAGANVLLTDLPTLVDHCIRPNLLLNQHVNTNGKHCSNGRPSWLEDPDAVPVGKGWVSAAALDWSRPVKEQLTSLQRRSIDYVVASDCVWLVSMLEGLFGTVESLFEESRHRQPKLLMSFQRRDPKEGATGGMFTSVDNVLDEIKKRGWDVECLAWRPVAYKGEESKEVFVFDICKQIDI